MILIYIKDVLEKLKKNLMLETAIMTDNNNANT